MFLICGAPKIAQSNLWNLLERCKSANYYRFSFSVLIALGWLFSSRHESEDWEDEIAFCMKRVGSSTEFHLTFAHGKYKWVNFVAAKSLQTLSTFITFLSECYGGHFHQRYSKNGALHCMPLLPSPTSSFLKDSLSHHRRRGEIGPPPGRQWLHDRFSHSIFYPLYLARSKG